MARKRREDEPPAGAPEWIVTFSDMVSLLVTFFVMLMSFSTIEEREAMTIVSAFRDSREGVMHSESGPNAVEPPKDDRIHAVHPRRGGLRPHTRPDSELGRNLEEMGQKLTDEHLEVDFDQVADGLQIVFDERCAFEPGSTEVNARLRRCLEELGRVLEHYEHLIVVEGFTDTEYKPTAAHPTPEALSSARAESAAAVLLSESDLAPEMVQVAGLGASRPRTSNDSAIDRSRNRRVEVRIISLSRARAEVLERERAEAREQGR